MDGFKYQRKAGSTPNLSILLHPLMIDSVGLVKEAEPKILCK